MKRLQGMVAIAMVVAFTAACAAPAPGPAEVVEVTREVEKVEEREVEVTREVEKVVTATPEATEEEGDTTGPIDGGTVVLMMDTSPGGYHNPILTPSDYGALVGKLIWPMLWDWNEDGSDVEGDLVESWEVDDDFTGMTLHLRENAVWHDGTPITAEDVEFTIWACSHPEIECNRGYTIRMIAGLEDSKRPPGVDSIEGVTVLDDKTLKLSFQEPRPAITVMEGLGPWFRLLPKHIMEDVPPEEFNDAEFWSNPTVGGGPFKFVEFKEDEYVELERFDDFYLGRPHIERIFIKIADPATIAAQLETGEIDMTSHVTTVPADDLARVAALPNVRIDTGAIGTPVRVHFNCSEDRPLADQRVRQAIAYAMNRELIVDAVLDGYGFVSNHFYLGTNSPYYEPELDELYPYDPDKARELLAEANWDPDTEVDLLVPTGEIIRGLAGDIVLANLTDVGIRVNYRRMEYHSLLSIVRNDRDYDMAFIRSGTGLDPEGSFSAGVHSDGAYNYSYREFPELDAVIEDLEGTLEVEDRKPKIREIYRVLNDVRPHVMVYYPYAPNAVNTRVHNVNFITGVHGFMRNVHEWWVEPAE